VSGARLVGVDSNFRPQIQGDQHRQVEELPHETKVAKSRSRHSSLGPVHLARVPGRHEGLGELDHGPEHAERRLLEKMNRKKNFYIVVFLLRCKKRRNTDLGEGDS